MSGGSKVAVVAVVGAMCFFATVYAAVNAIMDGESVIKRPPRPRLKDRISTELDLFIHGPKAADGTAWPGEPRSLTDVLDMIGDHIEYRNNQRKRKTKQLH